MRLTVIGCAGSLPGPQSPASCYLLEAEGFRLVLDLGNGALGALQRHTDMFGIDAVLLSHLHADHCVDLASYGVAREWAPGGPRPPVQVHGPRGTADRLAGIGGAGPAAQFTFLDLAPGPAEIGPFRITADRVAHPVETFGIRVEHAGWRLAYSADTGECDALVRLAQAADVLLCEASFLDDPGNPPGVHLSARQAGQHAARAGVGHLVLTHLVPWNDRDRSLAEAAGAFGGPVSLAASGQVLGPDRYPDAHVST